MQFHLRDAMWLVTTIAFATGFLACRWQLYEKQKDVEVLETRTKELVSKIDNLEKFKQTARKNKMAELFTIRGAALIRLERYEEATTALEAAVNFHPENLILLEKHLQMYREIGNEGGVQQTHQQIENVRKTFGNEPLFHIDQMLINNSK